jgi:hypothetical protein
MAAERKSDEFLNRVGGERIPSRQIDELIGLCRGMAAEYMLKYRSSSKRN